VKGSPIVPMGFAIVGVRGFDLVCLRAFGAPADRARWRGVRTRSAATRTLRQALQSPASACFAASHLSQVAAFLQASALRLPPRRGFIGPLADMGSVSIDSLMLPTIAARRRPRCAGGREAHRAACFCDYVGKPAARE